ncbi:MAG: DUF1501 domain-containing protein [Phycisphaerae bacterium]|nr:DUF1501 domain-containing protein [Phycisphaerae bacterium]MCZ2398324.1 DUF1501 domain-containing protein [Phycisphaerae bacterium]NUQ50217.1 DUF1501 domain-containing protein [Phycisphaerae bacterium]
MTNEPLYTTRREFLGGSLTLLSTAATLPVFLGRTVQALAGEEPAGGARGSHPILVVVQLAGGNDGLNTVIPYEMDGYYRSRPRLAIPARQVLKLEKGVGLHPSAEALKELFDEGKLAIIQGVGYPNPNRSHFTSMDIWHLADPDQRAKQGWLGRYFDACCNGSDPEPIDSIALLGEAPLALQGRKFMPLAFENTDALAWGAGRRDQAAAAAFRRLNNIDGNVPESEKVLADYLQRAALKAQVGADNIRSAAGASSAGRRARRGGAGGGGALGQQLQLVARLIQADLPTRVYYVSMGGFDTHTNQAGRHQQLLAQFGEAVQGFLDTLEEHKLQERVLLMTFSEFGRRVQENASGGTDHGEAAPMFLFGSKVIGGVHEKHPSLDRLHRGDLAYGVDFRRVYATVLRDWMKADAREVLGSNQMPLKLLRR